MGISLVLLLMGVFGLLWLQLGVLSNLLREELQVQVYLSEEAGARQQEHLKRQFAYYPGVRTVRFVSKDTAARELSRELGEDFLDFMGYNHCWPLVTYVLPDELTGPPFNQDFFPCPHKIKPYFPGRATGGITAVYRSGALGDAIMATGIVRYLVEKSGGTVDVYAPARNLTLYGGLGARLIPLPAVAEAWEAYDAHVPLDDLFSGKVMGSELGTGPGCFWDRIYRWMGAETDETKVDATYKRPTLTVIATDMDELGIS